MEFKVIKYYKDHILGNMWDSEEERDNFEEFLKNLKVYNIKYRGYNEESLENKGMLYVSTDVPDADHKMKVFLNTCFGDSGWKILSCEKGIVPEYPTTLIGVITGSKVERVFLPIKCSLFLKINVGFLYSTRVREKEEEKYSGKKLYEIHHTKYEKETFGKILVDFDEEKVQIYPKQNYSRGTHPDSCFKEWADRSKSLIDGNEANEWLCHHVYPYSDLNEEDLDLYSKIKVFLSNGGRSDRDNYCIEFLETLE